MVGFSIFMSIVLIVIFYPLFVKDPPLTIIGQGTFFPPGIYVNVYDSISSPAYTLNLDDAAAKTNCQQVERGGPPCHEGMACGRRDS